MITTSLRLLNKVNETVSVEYILYINTSDKNDTTDYAYEQRTLLGEAFLLTDEANEYTSFNEAIEIYEMEIVDTLTLIQSLVMFSY